MAELKVGDRSTWLVAHRGGNMVIKHGAWWRDGLPWFLTTDGGDGEVMLGGLDVGRQHGRVAEARWHEGVIGVLSAEEVLGHGGDDDGGVGDQLQAKKKEDRVFVLWMGEVEEMHGDGALHRHGGMCVHEEGSGSGG